MSATGLVQLLRPRQWYKNLIVFVPLVFSNNVATSGLWRPAAVTFAAFCLLSGASYAWNDAADAPRDRVHPRKRHRPVASGAVPPAAAVALGLAAFLAGLGTLWFVNLPTFFFGAAFVGLQILYNGFLKQQVIWDVLSIGVGFVVRALAGTTAIDVGDPTVWLILCAFLLALFLGFAKRRHELVLLAPQGGRVSPRRATFGLYTVAGLEEMTHVSATLLLMSYFLYTFFGPTAAPWMMLTIPFAVYGVLRYLFLIQRADLGDEPELVFRDAPTLINALAWLVVVVLVLQEIPQRFVEWLHAL